MSDSWIPSNNQDPRNSGHEGSKKGGIIEFGSMADYPHKLYCYDEVYYGNAISTQMGNTANVYFGGSVTNYTPYYISHTVGMNMTLIVGSKMETLAGVGIKGVAGADYHCVGNRVERISSLLDVCFSRKEVEHDHHEIHEDRTTISSNTDELKATHEEKYGLNNESVDQHKENIIESDMRETFSLSLTEKLTEDIMERTSISSVCSNYSERITFS